MPKKKRFRGKKDVNKAEILIEPEAKNMEQKSPVTETKEEAASLQDSKLPPPDHKEKQKSGIPKKRFSFSSKKKKHEKENEGESEQIHNKKVTKKTGGIYRSNSLSLETDNRSKIPLSKHRSLHHKGKHLSASCTNFETQSMVLNPGMDDWRMTGLLKNVEKSNSMCSLSSPSPSSSIRENQPPRIAIEPTTARKSLNAEVSADDAKSPDLVITGNNLGTVKENADLDDSMDNISYNVIVEEPDEDQLDEITCIDGNENIEQTETENTKEVENIVIVENTTTVDDLISPEDNAISNGEVTITLDDKVTTNSNSVDINKDDNALTILNSEIICEEIFVEECYDLDDDNVVTIQPLQDFITKENIEMPADYVLSNDWLILNLTHITIPIQTC